MENKHTPGPWSPSHSFASKIKEGWQIDMFRKEVSSREGFGPVCAAVGKTKEEAESNANLIAAAPEMKEFIERWMNEQSIAGIEGVYPEGSFGWKAQQILKKING